VDENHKFREVDSADLTKLWRGYGWQVIEIDGHNFQEIYQALRQALAQNYKDLFNKRDRFGKVALDSLNMTKLNQMLLDSAGANRAIHGHKYVDPDTECSKSFRVAHVCPE
jgi:transketolase